jgi:integrase
MPNVSHRCIRRAQRNGTEHSWRPALELAELEYLRPYKPPHMFAYRSLRACVAIATVAREMGHAPTEMAFRIHGGWCCEMSADAAAMRLAWADNNAGSMVSQGEQ